MVDPTAYALIEGASAPVFSVDGGTLFLLRGSGMAQIWALDLGSGAVRALTSHDEGVSQMRRAPGDDRLAYSIDAGGDERHQVWIWEDGVSRPLTAMPWVIHGLGAWSPDGTRLSIVSNDRDPAHQDRVTIEVASGVATRLFEGVHEAVAGGWHRDGRRVLMVQDRSTGDQRPFVVGLDGVGVAVPRRGATRFASLRWDGDGLMGLSDALGGGFMALCRFDPADGGAVAVFAPEGRDVEAWSLSSSGLLATVENDRGFAVLRVGSIDGRREVVEAVAGGWIADLAWSGDGGRLAFARGSAEAPAGLWVWEGGVARPVWRPACAVAVRPFELVRWVGVDGLWIEGWLGLPAGERPSAGWPAVVWVHGGPASQSRANFRADMQCLLAQGYAVLMPNVRGSTGYGRAFMDADDVERRLDSVSDLVAGARWLGGLDAIDAGRIAVMGQSYGGYMVLAAVTEAPEVWRCAIDYYGIGDFGTLLASTGVWRRAHRAAEYGDPVRHRALFDRISPLRHMERVRVPLLVLHGVRDPRVAIAESEAVVARLRALGQPVEYLVFDYAGHGFVRPDDRVRAFGAVAAFLAARL